MMRKEIRKIGVLSAMKVTGILYALLGLIMALFYIPFIGLYISMLESGADVNIPFGGAAASVAAIIILPIIYGLMGLIAGAIGALIYNLIVKWVGGYQIEMADVVEVE